MPMIEIMVSSSLITKYSREVLMVAFGRKITVDMVWVSHKCFGKVLTHEIMHE